MKITAPCIFFNGETHPRSAIPRVPFDAFREWITTTAKSGGRIVSLFGTPVPGGTVLLLCAIANDMKGTIAVIATEVAERYASITPDCSQAHLFECEIAEQCGIIVEGHPWLKPVRGKTGTAGESSISAEDAPFYRVEGNEIHEVAVGPVHAGILEPGHFRFQCIGEEVLHLEIRLGYQHRGIEHALTGGPDRRTIHYFETTSGDSTIGHALAGCQAIESLCGSHVPARAEALRSVALELERLANHTGDLGALAQDIGFQPTAAFCGRLRGEFLNMTAMLCGSRLGRGMIRPGGMGFDCDADRARELCNWLDRTMRDVTHAVELLWKSPSVLDRFEGTGRVTRETVEELGLVGPAARASGVARDCRYDFASGMYRFSHIPVSLCSEGDVYARARVRWLELQRSAAFVRDYLPHLPQGTVSTELGSMQPDMMTLTLVEGWRGEICHTALTDAKGRFAHYKIVDPSFHNWFGLAAAMRGEQISDFPVCNKSFNLSYCGHDL